MKEFSGLKHCSFVIYLAGIHMLSNTDLLKNFEEFCREYQHSEKRRGLFLFCLMLVFLGKLRFGSDNSQCALFLKVFGVASFLNVLVWSGICFIHLYQILFQTARFVCVYFHQQLLQRCTVALQSLQSNSNLSFQNSVPNCLPLP